MPVPHEKEPLPEEPQLIEPVRPGLVALPQAPWSAAGVVGLELAGEKELFAVKDALRGNELGISFNQEVRRVGLGAGACCDWFWWCSFSSSEDANASESGVERRAP